MKNLIITADDFGVFPSINEGIKQAIALKKVNSVACFPNHVNSVKNVKDLISEFGAAVDVGCHLTISSGRPLTISNNNSFTHGDYFRDFSALDIDGIERQTDLLQKELEAQVEVFLDNQVSIKHLSCHHNTLTTVESLFKIYLAIADKYKIPMRSVNIQPAKKDTNYRLVLDLLLADNVSLKKLREIRTFRKKIKEILDSFATVKTPHLLESRHYGPLPLIDVWEGGLERRKKEKHKDLRKFLSEFIKSDYVLAELMLHLIDYQEYLNGVDDGIDYPGVNKKYFDSRQVELKSILEFDFQNYKNEVQLTKWF